jgi:hypothetical protein
MRLNQLTESRLHHVKIKRASRMMLNPLTEIVVAMLMAVGVGGSQFMVHILRNGERRKDHEEKNQADRETGS